MIQPHTFSVRQGRTGPVYPLRSVKGDQKFGGRGGASQHKNGSQAIICGPGARQSTRTIQFCKGSLENMQPYRFKQLSHICKLFFLDYWPSVSYRILTHQ